MSIAQDEQNLQSLILNTMTDGVYFVRASDFKIVYTNPKFEPLFGYERGELIGQPVTVLNFNDSSSHGKKAAEEIAQTLIRCGQWKGEIQNVKKDGSPFWCLATVKIFEHPEHGAIYVAIHQDITERKQAEASLIKNQALLNETGNLGKIGGWEFDLIKQELTWTDEVYHIHEVDASFKPTVDKAIGFYTPASIPIITQALQRTIDQGDPYDLELEIITAKGNSRMVRALGKRRLFSAEAKTVFGVFQNITERRQADEALREAKEAAEQANRSKDLFLATLSHELRTPLTAILSWSQLIKTGKLAPDKAQKGIGAIEQSALAQSRLINDLLDVSRIASGKLVLDCWEISPAQVLFEEINAVALAAAEKQIEVLQDIDPEVTTIFADPVRLRQILWNLLGNALKFSSRGGKLWVSLRRRGDYAEFAIRDNGMGIAPDFLGQLFNRFSQADSSSTRHHGGLGLGLAISSSLCRMMGGTIKAESPGKGLGATFTVSLPIRAVALQTESPLAHKLGIELIPQPTSEELDLIKGVKILCVDDDPPTLEAIKMVLESYGLVVRPVLSAKEALEVLNTFTPNLIVSDIAMPELDGYGLLKQIRNRPSQHNDPTPVIALTAFAGPEDQKRANEAGFQGYLAKPVDASVLLKTVARLVKK